jgi:hypothetical protein
MRSPNARPLFSHWPVSSGILFHTRTRLAFESTSVKRYAGSRQTLALEASPILPCCLHATSSVQ